MEASEPKWINSILNIIGVNSLKLGGHHLSIVVLVINLPKKYTLSYQVQIQQHYFHSSDEIV